MKEKEPFGRAVDIINGAMKGLFAYCILLLAGFRMYQNGKIAFMPFLYALAVPFFVLLVCIYRFMRKDTSARRHAKRFKSMNYVRWGVGMFACSFFLFATADPATNAFPVSVQMCGRYMVGAFGIYLVLVVLLEYVYQQYDYFRNHAGIGKNTLFQLRRMNLIVTVIVAVLMFFVLLFTKETLALWMTEGYLKLLGFLAAAGMIGLKNLESAQLKGGTHVDPDGLSKLTHKIKKARPDSDFPVETVVTILLLIGVLYLLWRLYKTMGANFHMEGDEAQYIPRRVENAFEIVSIKEEKEHIKFGNGNRAKVRRMYYKTMNRRMKKDTMEQVKGKTPAELVQLYAQAGEQEQLQAMSGYYEKARYSNQVCTETDVEAVRKLAEHAGTKQE